MTISQILIVGILLATVGLFLWGRWRHDMVAGFALLASVLAGVVPATEAFAGFGHPAVITVACVLVLSRGLQTSGAVDMLARAVLPARAGPTLTIASLTVFGSVLSAFMNNVGALALLMPVALQRASRLDLPPGRVLMPLAFGSILGGMTTLIGTPPNLIVSGFRAETGAGTFGMFDFTPVGLAVAGIGLAFIVFGGWRLVPARRRAGAEGFDTAAYFTEARVKDTSKAVGRTLRDIEIALDAQGAQVVGVVRHEVRLFAPGQAWVVRAGDILVLEAEADVLADVLSTHGLELEEGKKPRGDERLDRVPGPDGGDAAADAEGPEARNGSAEGSAPSSDTVLMELVVLPGSMLTGRSASDILLRTRYGINLLAVSRQGHRSMARLRTVALAPGDVLLVQGAPEALTEFAANTGCVPLAERELRIPEPHKTVAATVIMLAAVGGAAFGLVPAAIAFAAGALASMVVRTVPPRVIYDAVDWPVIVLLGGLIPVAGAMESTGAAAVIAHAMLAGVAQGHPVIALTLVLIVTMTLSDLINNAATAAVMCPIAISAAAALGVNPDAFLMAVAIGASCAFLTPIGHQNNTLILGPGGLRFRDYWPLGLPVEVLVVLVSVPVLLLVWPL